MTADEADPGAAGSERAADLATAVEQPGDGDREVHGDAAVGRARIELARESGRHGQRDAAVDGLQVESRSIPLFVGQLDAQPAVDGLASDVAVHVAEHDAAVHGVCVDAAADVLDDDAAVGGVHAEVGLARHLQLEGDGPVAVIVPVAGAAAIATVARAVGADASAGRGDLDVLGDLRGGVAAVVPYRDPRAHLHIGSIPSADRRRRRCPRASRSTVLGFGSVSSRTSQKSARRS